MDISVFEPGDFVVCPMICCARGKIVVCTANCCTHSQINFGKKYIKVLYCLFYCFCSKTVLILFKNIDIYLLTF